MVGVHFVGGWIGSLSIGLFASTAANSAHRRRLGKSEGLFYGGGSDQLGAQVEASGIVSVYSFARGAHPRLGHQGRIGLFRVKPEVEVDGIDIAEHAESAYDLARPAAAAARPVRSRMAGIGGGAPAHRAGAGASG